MIHYKRADIIIKWLLQVISCIHWFNPLIYLLTKKTNEACELSCNELVIRNFDFKQKHKYGETLISSIQTDNTLINTPVMVTLSKDANTIKERLDAIMKYKKPTKLIVILSSFFLVLLLIVGIFIGSATTNSESIVSSHENTSTTKQSQLSKTIKLNIPKEIGNIIEVIENGTITVSGLNDGLNVPFILYSSKYVIQQDSKITFKNDHGNDIDRGQSEYKVGIVDAKGNAIESTSILKQQNQQVTIIAPKTDKYFLYIVPVKLSNEQILSFAFDATIPPTIQKMKNKVIRTN